MRPSAERAPRRRRKQSRQSCKSCLKKNKIESIPQKFHTSGAAGRERPVKSEKKTNEHPPAMHRALGERNH